MHVKPICLPLIACYSSSEQYDKRYNKVATIEIAACSIAYTCFYFVL